jgi:hypothetical protein
MDRRPEVKAEKAFCSLSGGEERGGEVGEEAEANQREVRDGMMGIMMRL